MDMQYETNTNTYIFLERELVDPQRTVDGDTSTTKTRIFCWYIIICLLYLNSINSFRVVLCL